MILTKNNSGFTLIEVMISIVLLSFVMFGVVSITDNTEQTKNRTLALNEDNLEIENLMQRLEWDFSQIYSPLYFSYKFTLPKLPPGSDLTRAGLPSDPVFLHYENNEHFEGPSREGIPIPKFYSPDKASFEFFTTSNRRRLENTKQSHFAWVRYAVADDTETKNEEDEPLVPDNEKTVKTGKALVRYFSADNPYAKERINPEKLKASIMLKNIESVEFSFWDPNRKVFESNLTTIPNGVHILRALKIVISWYDSKGFKREATRIFRPLWPNMILPEQTNNYLGNPTAISGSPATTGENGTNTNSSPAPGTTGTGGTNGNFE
jgi:prepilin-type N-terminal cleavage/methylation domain-containing protein